MEDNYIWDFSLQRFVEQKSKPSDEAHHPVYEHLPVSSLQTRVLNLHSDPTNTAPVSCSLEVLSLEPAPSKVYSALSYVWGETRMLRVDKKDLELGMSICYKAWLELRLGNASMTEDITVNGLTFTVTANLASALRQIRKTFGEILLWADAICMHFGMTI